MMCWLRIRSAALSRKLDFTSALGKAGSLALAAMS
jgi:hypothetical protein